MGVVVGMTTVPVTPVIPASPRGGGPGSGPTPRRRSPLPLPPAAPAEPPAGQVVYALSVLDRSGRVADRGIVRALGWEAGARLDVRERAGLMVVCLGSDGICVVDDRGFLVLPLAARRWCRLTAGDRLLLAAHRARGVLVAHPLPVLDRLLASALAPVSEGDAR